ncbi:histone deacetylase 6 isoform X1 [Rhizophagus irregularis DAOM 181602=DAOM 197198]|nr:histone deacetylase 6 isoform X1 [Rhizophagus irregularis DAOM 181602=DAOM 197198]
MSTATNWQAGFHPVTPRTNCPHLHDNISPNWAEVTVDVSKPCTECNDASENWRCLRCQGVYCSRYINGHAAEHHKNTSHPISISFSDLSIWCYDCDDYITSRLLKPITTAFYVSKFGEMPPNSNDIEIASEEDTTGSGEGPKIGLGLNIRAIPKDGKFIGPYLERFNNKGQANNIIITRTRYKSLILCTKVCN